MPSGGVADYPNEFNPSQWSPNVFYPDDNLVGGVPVRGMAASTVIITAVFALLTNWGICRTSRSRGDSVVESEMEEV